MIKKPKMQTKAMTKTDVVQGIVDFCSDEGVTKKQAAAMLAALLDVGEEGLKKSGAFMLPGFVKITVVVKPATKARVGIDPFTKQQRQFAAKPERIVLKARVMGAMKERIAS